MFICHIHNIQSYVREILSPEDLLADSKTYDAVLMNFIVIGESANKLSGELKSNLPEIDWKAINGFRNFIAHEYFGIDIRIVWAAIQFELPKLKSALTRLLDTL